MRSRVYQRGATGVSANMTPMIDVVFLLIIFFMLVSQIQRARLVELTLPEIEDAATDTPARDSVVVVNVVPEGRDSAPYRLGSLEFDNTRDGLDALVRQLARERERDSATIVLVRADRTEPYERVHPVLQAVSDAGLTRVQLLTLAEDPGS
ncbi:MAG: ExbD/TolR family protein [Phycisphaerales bacterium JB065]